MILTECARTVRPELDGCVHAIARIEDGYLRYGDVTSTIGLLSNPCPGKVAKNLVQTRIGTRLCSRSHGGPVLARILLWMSSFECWRSLAIWGKMGAL